MKTKIIILVSGGNITDILSTEEVEVKIRDYDSNPCSTAAQELDFFHYLKDHPLALNPEII